VARLFRRCAGAAGAPWALVALFMWVAFIGPFSCSEAAVQPGPQAPVFPYAGALRQTGPGAPILFSLGGSVRLRSLSRAFGGFLLWDAASMELRLLDDVGRRRAAWPLDAAFVWIDGELVFARGKAFEEGRGFRFSLLRAHAKRKPRLLWEGYLDCFPSDIVFMDASSLYLAGADQADEVSSIYHIRAGRSPECILSLPKDDAFLRLVSSGGRILAFQSAREKSPRRGYFGLWAGETFHRADIDVWPSDALCAYGYGFTFGGDFVLPLAMADGSVALARLEAPEGEGSAASPPGLKLAGLARDSGGSYLTLGPDPSAPGFWYLAHDALEDPRSFALGFYDGDAARLVAGLP